MAEKEDTLAVVQFIHPGKEQTNVDAGWCEWGKVSDPHRRKFMLSEASFLHGDVESKGIVGFWGEWEGPSYARRMPRVENENRPRFVHLPAYYKPRFHEGLWDTDPFVFGDRFLYNGCQQHTRRGLSETFLRRLAPGSVILFGSSIARRFVLDTVFVVGDYTDYQNGVWEPLAGLVPDEYFSLGLRTQALIEPSVDSFRLYRGSTYGERVGDMFSFTPCRARSDGDERLGFARPNVVMPCVTQNLTQGKKMTRVKGLDTMRKLWADIRFQVEAAGCLPAHRIELNPKVVRQHEEA